MTLAAMWIESHKGRQKALCFASDSRTSPGPIDGVTKVLLFSRPDVAAVWAGDFRYASILAGHLDVVLSATPKRRERDIDLERLFRIIRGPVESHLTATTAGLIGAVRPNALAQDPEQLTLLVGGYSIVCGEFVAMQIKWNPSQARWITALERVAPGRVKIIGDREYRSHAKWRARRIRAHRSTTAQDWHMEPFAAIDAYSRDPHVYSVGGGVQLAKAFVHGTARGFAIREPLSKEATLRGSRLSATVTAEYEGQNQLIDMARWSLSGAYYGGIREHRHSGQ